VEIQGRLGCGCDFGQGYLFSRPLPREDIEVCSGSARTSVRPSWEDPTGDERDKQRRSAQI
jgi:FOG: EAL domain